MASDESLVTSIGFAMVVRFGGWRFWTAASPLDFSASAGAYLLFGVFLAKVSNSRIDRAARDSSCRRILTGSGGEVRACCLLVCADTALVFKQRAHAQRNLLGGNDCFGPAGLAFLAARHVVDLFCVFSFVREWGAGFLRLSIGWDAARSGFYRALFLTGWFPAGVG